MSLISVRRLYPNATPPTAWTLDGTPLSTKRFRFTKRTDQASSASFECSGSPALTKKDRVFAYGLTDIAGALGAAITVGYTSQYPPAQSDTYVKATTKFSTNYWPYFATDPALSLTGGSSTRSWMSAAAAITNQRSHIDLGSAKVLKRVYYENFHATGASTDIGVRHFTIWGSNNAAAFAELTYGIDTNWTQITAAVAEFDIHAAVDAADPKYFTVTNSTAYRYYAFKFADNWGSAGYMGVRRIELQTEAWGTTLTLAAAGEIPAENWLVGIDSELIWCGARTGTAVSACVRGIGGTTPATHANGTPVYVYWTWGGIVKSVRRTKKGYAYGCLDFIDYLDCPVTKDYPSGTTNTDVEILEDGLTFLQAPLNLQLDHVGITPTDMYAVSLKNKSIRSVLEEFCLLSSYHYYGYQAWYDLNPQIRYFTPSGAASGITLAAGDIYADWSTEEDRMTIVNSLDAVATFPDIAPDPLTGYLWGTLEYSASIYDACIGTVANRHSGFKFHVPVDGNIGQLLVYMKKVGAFTGNVWVTVQRPDLGTTSYVIVAGAGLTTSYTWIQGVTLLPVQAGTNYIDFYASELDNAKYVMIGVVARSTTASDLDTHRSPMGIGQSLYNVGAAVYSAGALELNNTIASALSCTIRDNAFAAGTWVDVSGGKMGAHPAVGWLFSNKVAASCDYYWPLLVPISATEYPYVEVEVDVGYDNPTVGLLLYNSALAPVYWSWSYVAGKRGTKITIPISGAGTDIAYIGFRCQFGVNGFLQVKSVRFVGSTYTKSVSDTNSRKLYETKYQSFPVPFRSKAQTDTYAAAQLARLKDPLLAVAARSNRLLTPTPYTTVSVSPGSAMTPLVLGADIDPVKDQTKFVFGAYPAGGLVAILSSLAAGIG